MSEVVQRFQRLDSWRSMYFGNKGQVHIDQQLDENEKPEYPCTFAIEADHVPDVVAAETIIEEIKAAIKLARQWNRELLTAQEPQ